MYHIFFVLLRAGLWGKAPEDLSEFPLNRERWNKLFEIAKKQTVTGIVYHGVTMLPEKFMPPQELMIRWVAEVERIEQNNHKTNLALQKLLRLFRDECLRPIVLKGQSVAAMYETPSLRECGDIDIFFDSQEDASDALAILKEKGITYERHADQSISYVWEGVVVEHHTVLFDLHRPKSRKYANKFIKKFRHMRIPLHEHTKMTVLAPMPYLITLNTHILKHTLGMGVGLRQLCDLARAYYYLNGKVEHHTMRDTFKTLGLTKWSKLLHAFIVKHIGLPWQYQPYISLQDIDTAPLFSIIRESGNFGQHAKGSASSSPIKTALRFWKRKRFAWKYAFKEYLWIMLRLTKGRIK